MLVLKEVYLHVAVKMDGLTICDSIAIHFHLQEEWENKSLVTFNVSVRNFMTQYAEKSCIKIAK